MAVDTALLGRAGELKRELVEFAQQPQYHRPFSEVLGQRNDKTGALDEAELMTLLDYFVLEHRLRNGRTVVEQFVGTHADLSPSDREMLLGWRDVVQGPFEVQRRDGQALIVVNLVDELTYRVRSNVGPSVFRQMPRRSFLITRIVPVGDEWMLSGLTNVLSSAEGDIAFRLALEISMNTPEAVFRNREKLAKAWEIQREHRQRFMQFFGTDLVVVPGDQVQSSLEEYYAFCHQEAHATAPDARCGGGSGAPQLDLPPEIADSETVALIYDDEDGLGFYAEFGAVEAAFADPDLVRRRRYREQVLSYLHDDSVEPMVLRRMGDRDREKASVLFSRLLKRPHFDWARDGEQLLRTTKPDYYATQRRPQVSPVSERLAAYAQQQ